MGIGGFWVKVWSSLHGATSVDVGSLQLENRGLFTVESASANGALAANDQYRQGLDKAMVWAGGFSDVAGERSSTGVFFCILL